MGKQPAAAPPPPAFQIPKKKKKRGRPSFADLQKRAAALQSHSNPQNPRFGNPSLAPAEFIHECSDDDERREKKVKLVVRLPEDGQIPKSTAEEDSSLIPLSLSCDNCDTLSKKRKINGDNEGVKAWKATDPRNGMALEPGPTDSTTATPMPDKKLLLVILDKLQKKDTRGVFAEPVDPEELPDYHEIIENPMDFGTVRKKLDGGLYPNLEQFEADIFLICSNAMQYNPSHTIFFRQARSIQELGKKEFETLRQDGGGSESPPRVAKRGRPPGSRSVKKLIESSFIDRVDRDSTPDTTLASQGDESSRSSAYNLRKGPSLYRFPSVEGFARALEGFDLQASASKAMSLKNRKKPCELDESRRDTFKQPCQVASGPDPPVLSTTRLERKQLIPVGLNSEHSYARSLAQFAANLGPLVWHIASKKIRTVLPPGLDFGPGWVAEATPSSSKPVSSKNLVQNVRVNEANHLLSTSGFSNSAMADKSSLQEVFETWGLSSQPEWPLEIQQRPVIHHGMNGYNGGFRRGFVHDEGSVETSRKANGAQWLATELQHGLNVVSDLEMQGKPYWQALSMQERWDSSAFPIDLNVGLQASGSGSSGLQIGSPTLL